MPSFAHAYRTSAKIFGVLFVLSTIGGIGSGMFSVAMTLTLLALLTLMFFPILRKGGVPAHPRLSIIIAATLTVFFAGACISNFNEFVQTRGGEGPNGEGSPLANMIAMAFFALATLCPWLLTFLRGLPLWNEQIETK